MTKKTEEDEFEILPRNVDLVKNCDYDKCQKKLQK